MAKRLVWTASAKVDRNSILSFWKEKTLSKRYSKTLNSVFINQAESLLTHPLLGKQTEIESIRCLPFGDYSLFYQIKENSIIIHRIWDNRQNPESFHI